MRTALHSFIFVSLVGLLGVGCAYRSKEQVITAADLNVPERTRMTNYMSAPMRPGQPSEEPPVSGISRSVLLDEARIAKVGDGEVCFDIIVRTGTELDTAISEMRILVADKPGRVGDESVAITDHSFKGERDVLVAEHVSKTALSALRLTAPTSEVFRVFERRAQVCRSMPPPKRELVLEVIILKDDNRGNYGEKFVWRIE